MQRIFVAEVAEVAEGRSGGKLRTKSIFNSSRGKIIFFCLNETFPYSNQFFYKQMEYQPDLDIESRLRKSVQKENVFFLIFHCYIKI